MDNSLKETIAAKTDKELADYLIDIKDHSAVELRTVVSEMQKRGKIFNQTQLEYIQAVIKKKLIDEDPATPFYYSKLAVFTFAFFFSVFAGAIVLSLNIKDRRDKWVVIGFGLTCTVLMYTFESSRAVMFAILAVNAIGGLILQTFFWNRYIGKDVPYKKKPILLLVLLAIAIMIPIILFTIRESL